MSDPFTDFMLRREPERLHDIDRRYFLIMLGLLIPFTVLGYFYL